MRAEMAGEQTLKEQTANGQMAGEQTINGQTSAAQVLEVEMVKEIGEMEEAVRGETEHG